MLDEHTFQEASQFNRVMISANEEQDASISPAMDGLLKVHKRTIDGLDKESGIAPPGNAVITRLLVPATQAGSLIGKQGVTIKSIQEASNCIVRIIDDLPPVALQDDRVVEVQGEPVGLHKAVELISSHLRKFLVDRSVLQLFEMQMQAPHPHMDQIIPPPQPWGPPQGHPPNAAGSSYGGPPGYGSNPGYGANPGFGGNPGYGGPGYGANQGYGNPQFMPPSHPHDNFYPPPDVPPFEKPPHYGISTYGREAPPMGGVPSSNRQPPPMASQVTQHMQIPLSYADAVIGNAGASISYIRRASGATVTIQETRGVPGEMTVEITGSASQVQTAQQLIQNFMAEAAGPGQTAPPAAVQNSMGPVDEGYNSYQNHGSMYAAPPTNAGPPAHPGGGYGSAYGTNYRY